MRRRWAALLVPVLLVGAVGATVAWQKRLIDRRTSRSSQRPISDKDRADARNYMVQYYGNRDMSREQALANRRLPTEARWFATHSVRVGDFLVGLRHLYAADRGLMQYPAMDSPAPGMMELGLQIVDLKSPDKPRARLITDSLQLVDNTGKTISLVDPRKGGLAEPVGVPGAVVYILDIEVKNADADRIALIKGRLGPVTERFEPIPFEFHNVPLLHYKRLFGEFETRLLDPKRASGLPSGLVQIPDQSIHEIEQTSKPMPFPKGYPRSRLLILKGLDSRFPVQVKGPELTLRCSEAELSSFRTTIILGDQEISCVQWEQEPSWFALPANNGQRLAVRLTLTRDPRPQSQTPPESASMFPPPPRKAGGSLVARILVGDKPFGPASVSVLMWRRIGSNWSKPARTNASIGLDGSLRIPNLAPGRYKLQPDFRYLSPRQVFVPAAISLTEYLAYRFGVVGGTWSQMQVEDALVRPGQATQTVPFCLVNTQRIRFGQIP